MPRLLRRASHAYVRHDSPNFFFVEDASVEDIHAT
jgi:hypothetical protein